MRPYVLILLFGALVGSIASGCDSSTSDGAAGSAGSVGTSSGSAGIGGSSGNASGGSSGSASGGSSGSASGGSSGSRADATVGRAPAWFVAMPDRTWATPAVNKLEDVAPNPLPPGAEGQSAVCNDWTGAVSDQTLGEYMLPAQGGHNGYYGNEIYAIALRAEQPAWQRIWGPTPNAQIQTNDHGYNPPDPSYSDGSPRSIHGWFQQQVDASGRIWLLATGASPSGHWGTSIYSIDRGNLAQGWMKHGRLWPTIPGGAPGSSFGYQSGPSAYDRVANRIWRAADFATEDGVASIDVAQAVAAGQQSSAGPKVPGSTIYPVELGGNPFGNSWSVITTGLSPRSWIVGSSGESRLYVMDLENNPGTFVTRTTSGSPDGWTEGVGAAYHAPSRAILVGGIEYGAKIRKLTLSTDNPLTATYTWSEVSPAAANTIVPAVGGDQYRGTFSKFQMIEDMGNGQAALCFVASVSGPLFVYKLPAGAL